MLVIKRTYTLAPPWETSHLSPLISTPARPESDCKLLLMLNTERLDSFTKGNFDMTRRTFGGKLELIGTGRSRCHRLKEGEKPGKQRYEGCQ